MLRIRCGADPVARSVLYQTHRQQLRHYRSRKAVPPEETQPATPHRSSRPRGAKGSRSSAWKSKSKSIKRDETPNAGFDWTFTAPGQSPDPSLHTPVNTSQTGPQRPSSPPKRPVLWTTLRERLEALAQEPSGVELAESKSTDHDGSPKPPRSAHPRSTDEKKLKGVSKDVKTPPKSKTKKSSAHPRDTDDKELKEVLKAVKTPPQSKTKKSSKRSSAPSSDETESHVGEMIPGDLEFKPVNENVTEVPRLSHKLDRVLFNPGVYQLQDNASEVFNFDPYLATIMPNDEFDFDALKGYVTSSEDIKLRELSAAHGSKYCGSTSSMTSILSHFHYLLSHWKEPSFSSLSRDFKPDSYNFTQITRAPASAFLTCKDGIYAIDAGKEFDTESVLSLLGKSMEKMLTLPKEEFEKYRRTRSHELSDEEKNADENYHYTTLGDFMMRSQLDAYDPRLQGTGVFDLKTRAVVSIRMDVHGPEKGAGYEIRQRLGQWNSFEREYYDMIRAAFLKYSLQVRMGRMEGIFVAYHNTRRIFGFQYISLEEMDLALHGTPNRSLGDMEFKASVALLNELLNKATERYPGRSLRLHVETRPTATPLTYFFVEPVSDEEISLIQQASKSSAEEVQNQLEALQRNESDNDMEESKENIQSEHSSTELDGSPGDEPFQKHWGDNAWQEMVTGVKEIVNDEGLGLDAVQRAAQEALDQRGLLQDKEDSENERCVDALVEALTASWAETGELRATPDDDLLSHESTEHAHELTLDTSTEHSSHGSPPATTEQDATLGGEQPGPGPGPVAEKGASVDEAEHLEHETEPSLPTPSEDSMESISLKLLILRGVEKIDRKAGITGAFEHSLAELAAKPRQADTKSGDEQGDDLDSTNKLPPGDAGSGEAAVDTQAATETPKTPDGDSKTASAQASDPDERELFAMYVTIRNKVNGEFVDRPTQVGDTPLDWSVMYSINEIPNSKAQRIYSQIKKRRKTVFQLDPRKRAADWYKMFGGKLSTLSKSGEEFRTETTNRAQHRPIKVAWDTEP